MHNRSLSIVWSYHIVMRAKFIKQTPMSEVTEVFSNKLWFSFTSIMISFKYIFNALNISLFKIFIFLEKKIMRLNK